MGFVPPGATYGAQDWSHEMAVDATDDDAKKGAKQHVALRADHTTHVYFADHDKPYCYFIIDHVRVAASPGDALANHENARGFFNSSVYVGYDELKLPAGCSVTKKVDTPSGMGDDLSFTFRGTEMVLWGSTSGGDGRVDFTPEYSARNNIVKGWSLVRAATSNAWIAHQRDVWNALNVDGPTGTAVPTEWIDSLFNGSPFGKIVKMPDASFGTVSFELVNMWRIDRSGNPFTPDSREVTVKVQMNYCHRANIFVNATIDSQHDPKRGYISFAPKPGVVELKLQEIAQKRMVRRPS